MQINKMLKKICNLFNLFKVKTILLYFFISISSKTVYAEFTEPSRQIINSRLAQAYILHLQGMDYYDAFEKIFDDTVYYSEPDNWYYTSLYLNGYYSDCDRKLNKLRWRENYIKNNFNETRDFCRYFKEILICDYLFENNEIELLLKQIQDLKLFEFLTDSSKYNFTKLFSSALSSKKISATPSLNAWKYFSSLDSGCPDFDLINLKKIKQVDNAYLQRNIIIELRRKELFLGYADIVKLTSEKRYAAALNIACGNILQRSTTINNLFDELIINQFLTHLKLMACGAFGF